MVEGSCFPTPFQQRISDSQADQNVTAHARQIVRKRDAKGLWTLCENFTKIDQSAAELFTKLVFFYYRSQFWYRYLLLQIK